MTKEKEVKRRFHFYEKQIEHNRRKQAKRECQRCNEVEKIIADIRQVKRKLRWSDINEVWRLFNPE